MPVRDPRPRVATVAAIAGLVGALLGSAVATAVTGTPEPVAQRSFSTSAPAAGIAQAPAPAVTVTEAGVDRVAAVADAVLPTVVQIDIEGRGEGPVGNGSGVIFRADGHILTNNHVVAGADELEVVFADGSSAAAEVIGTDETTDLAVVRVDVGDLPVIVPGDSATLQVGELAIALGSPFGLNGSVTAGIVSAIGRQIPVRGSDGQPETLTNVIQTDAPINPGNSGGPLVDGEGRLIGINSAILTAGSPANAGVGFAIPVNAAIDIADELIANGFVRHPFLGVQGETLGDDEAARLGVVEGAVVRAVQPGTPASDAGLAAGDVIVAVDDTAITAMDDLIVAIRNAEVGASVTIAYVRDGSERTVEATLGEIPR